MLPRKWISANPKELTKVTTICAHTSFPIFLYWSIIYHHTVLAFSPCLNNEQMQLMLCMLCFCFLASLRQIYQIIVWIHRRAVVKIFFNSKKTKSNFWLWQLVQLQPRIPKTTSCWKMTFCEFSTWHFTGEVDKRKTTCVKFLHDFVCQNYSNGSIFD